jgi:hypothetical protein
MMENEYLVFRRFSDKNEALVVSELLRLNDFVFLLEDSRVSFDPTFSFNESRLEYFIKLAQKDFSRADSVLLEHAKKQLNQVEDTYYLFSFTDSELLDVVAKRDMWSNMDYVLALRLLQERGHEINEETLSRYSHERLIDLAKPTKSGKDIIFIGYVTAIWGGVIGLIIGWHLSTHKKTLPNGQNVFTYTRMNRIHGQVIFCISALVAFIFLLNIMIRL